MKEGKSTTHNVKSIAIRHITGNPYQTRIHMEAEPLKTLAKSIRERGLFNPITVLEKAKNNYIVVHGHRRLEACKKLRWERIPAFVKPRVQENSLITDLIHENLVREDLSVQEKALSIKLLFSQIPRIKDDVDAIISCISGVKMYRQRGARKVPGRGAKNKVKWTDDDMFLAMKLLKTIGMSENNAISYLTVLKLPLSIQKMVRFNVHNGDREATTNRISIRLANQLARVDDNELRDYLLERALCGSSSNHIEMLVNDYILKASRGEWHGYCKERRNVKIIKGSGSDLLVELAKGCSNLAKRMTTFRIKKLRAVVELMEKDLFVASGGQLRKEIRLLDTKLQEALVDKGWKSVEGVEGNEVFEMSVKRNVSRATCRGTIPQKVLKKLGIQEGHVQVKIIKVRQQEEQCQQ